MKLGVHYSPQMVQLLDEGTVEFDYFKVPFWPDLIAQAQALRPAYIHFPLLVGSGIGDAIAGETGATSPVDWGAVEAALHQTGTPFVNVHLAPLIDHHPDIPNTSQDAGHIDRVTEALICDVRAVVRRFGAERVIAENNPVNDTRILSAAMRPEVICRVIEETGCGLLLDLSHARLSAPFFQMEVHDYLEALPVAHIRELHISGVQRLEGVWLERMQATLGAESPFLKRYQNAPMDHLPMTDEDWGLVEAAFGHIASSRWAAPETVGFEYSGVALWQAVTEIEILRADVPRLWSVVHPQTP
ncbi:MAG: DUF692 family protein [bacterium]|nr:DUF692 family protein [bacterium]